MPIDKKFLKSVVEDVEGASSGRNAKVEHWLESGNYALNYTISGKYTKGLPFGKVVEVFGDPSTGKSLLIYHWIAEVQKMGGVAILDDSEDSYSEEFGSMLGIDNDAIILLSSLTVEEHFEKVFLGWKDSKGRTKPGLIDLIWEKDMDCPILVALDSLALLSTKHEQEVRLEKPDMSKAKIIRAALRNSAEWMKKGNLLHVIANHVTSKIGVMFGNPKTTPGGSGVPFSASVRLELDYMGKIKDGDKVIGVKSRVRGAKNKISAPFKEAELEIYFNKGVEPFSGLFEQMLSYGIIKDGEKRGQYLFDKEMFKKSDFVSFIMPKLEIASGLVLASKPQITDESIEINENSS